MSSTPDAASRGSVRAPHGPRGLATRRRARATRRFYLLTLASTVVPGLGLIGSRRRTGLVLLGGFVALVVGLVAYGMTRGFADSAIEIGVSRRALLWLIPLLLVVAGGWVYGIVRTARDNLPAGSSGTPRIAMLTFTALACVLVVAPAAQAARYAVIQRSVLATVFPSLAPDDATTPGGGADPWAETERVNVLLVGSDAGPDRDGIRPDSVMVASVDTQTGDTVLFGIPRNLQNVPFSEDNPLHEQYPDGFDCGDTCLMEHVWTLGSENEELFDGDPNPGLTVTKDAVGEVLGLDIDYTTVIDLRGFQSLVDAMGGVEIDVQERVCVGCSINSGGVVVGTTDYIEPGVQRLNGYYALWYSRSRAESTDGDFSRMRRQRCMVGALLGQVNPVNMLARYPELADVLKKNVSVDIPQQDLDEWAILVQRIQSDGSIKSLPLTNKNIDVNRPDYRQIHQMVQRAIDPPEPTKQPEPSSSPTSSPTSAPTPTRTPGSTPSATPRDELSDLSATC